MCSYFTSPFRILPPTHSPSLRTGVGKSLPCLSSCKAPLEKKHPVVSVAVIPLPQAAAVAAEDLCPALPWDSFPPHISPQRPGQLPGQAEC